MPLSPLVTGIAPREGYPGTKVTIRGENLGSSYDDLVAVKICGVDVTLTAEWINDKKIIAYTGLCKGKGDVVVVTLSGGIGTSSVGFQGLIKKNIGPTDETAVWVEEDPKTILTGLKKSPSDNDIIDNPLGISVDDSSNITIEQLDKEFPNSSSDIRKENFNSNRFLLENYQNAKFKDLKDGLEFLKSNADSKTSNSNEVLLKNNISSFMDAIKILKNIYNLSAEDKRNRFLKSLETMLNDVLKAAHKIYDQDLEHKDRADIIRNSLSILNEYKFVFAFPQTIESCLKREDYEPIISGFKSVKLVLSRAESRNSNLFKNVKIEVDHKIEQVKKTLIDKLTNGFYTPDEQRIIIEYLYSIGFNEFDVGWYCLEQEKKNIIESILKCRDSFISSEIMVNAEIESSKDNQKSETNGNTSINSTTTTTTTTSTTNTTSQNIINNKNLQPHERNKFIEKLCEMFLDIFTDYWRFGNMYSQGQLLPKQDDDIFKQKKNNKLKMHSIEEFHNLIREILTIFSNIVRTAFIPETIENLKQDSKNEKIFEKWPKVHDVKITSQILPHCLRVCRMCALQINALELPLSLFETLQELIYDLRSECLKILLITASHEILKLVGKEEQDWVIDRDADIGAYTNMPIRFETIFLKYLTLIKEFVLDDKKGEKILFKDSMFVKSITNLIYGCVHSYLKRFKQLMLKQEELPSFVNITRNKMILYLYNNLILSTQKILPNIWNFIKQHNYPHVDAVIRETNKVVKEIQEQLILQYMLETIKPITTNIEHNMYVGKYDYIECSPPLTVRNYIKIIVINLISVHSELFTINKSLITRVLTYAVNEIYVEIYKLLSTVPKFSDNSAMQTYIDIFCLKETLKNYSANNESNQLMNKILQLIPQDSFQQNKNLMIELITEFQARMNPYILVLQNNVMNL